MKITLFNRPRRASRQASTGLRASGAALTAALLLLATANLTAGVANGVVVGTVCGGGYSPYYGSREGNPVNSTDAQFHTPIGLALDSTGEYLFVADRDNNKLRVVDLPSSSTHYNFTYTFAPVPGFTPPNAITNPVGVALDAGDDVYVLNRGNGKNGTVVVFDYYFGDLLATSTMALTNANAITLDNEGNVYVTASNNLFRITFPGGVTTHVADVTSVGANLQGLVVMDSGMIAACDSGRNGILLINPTNGVISNLTGFNGAGDNANIWETTPNRPVVNTLAKFNQPTGLAKAGNGMLIVADYGNNRVKVVDSFGTVTNLYGVSSNLWYKGSGAWPGWRDGNVVVPDSLGGVEARAPNGVVFSSAGTVYVTEDYYHLIRKVTGANLPQPLPPPPGAPTILTGLADCGQVSLTWSTSTGATNYNVKRAASSSGPYTTITNTSSTSYTDTSVLSGTTYYYVVSAVGTGGESPDSAPVSATPTPPPAPTILTVLTNFYNQVTLTWSTVPCPSVTYYVKRSPSSGGPYTTITNTSSTSYTDTGLLDGTTYYYVVSAFNGGGESSDSAEASATTRCHPVPDPQIGYVDFPFPTYTSVFHPVSSYIAYNDTVLVIKGTPGSGIYYTYGYTTNAAAVANPTPASASIPSDYQDGLYPGSVVQYTISQVAPFLTVKAIGTKADCSPNSAVAATLFQFKTGNPNINGDNAAQFTISDITADAHLYYTTSYSTNGPDPWPTNGVDLGTVDSPTNVWTVGFNIQTNTLFKVRAFRDNYQSSAVVSKWFYPSNVLANIISFGFASGEASSAFVGSPGQTFYAPVTLSVLPGVKMYSLQFNITANSVGAAPAITNKAFDFQSMLMKPVVPIPTNYPTGFALYTNIPPYMFVNGGFTNLEFINSSSNLLGVGWLERYSETNLYDTFAQDLITYSMAHDDLFPNAQQPNDVIVGGYGFQIPANATCGEQYQIQIGRPSATSDGIGAPGSDVYIATPTNGSLTAGAMNSIKIVTIPCQSGPCQAGPKYLVGDCYPFHWFNAGDFGDTNLNNADVEQVFESAVYNLNTPPTNTDFYNSMDSCGGLGVTNANGYLVPGLSVTNPATLNSLFDGNDTNINSMAFGDGKLDVCDVYVTFRRSLDPSLDWFQRFWTCNGVRGAQVVYPQPNLQAQPGPSYSPLQPKLTASFLTNPPSVNFAAADFTASAGQTLQIPITARIFGDYPLRVLMLNLSVEPLDGSPALTSPVQFKPNAALGAAAMTSSTGNGNYAGTWLNSTVAGLTGNATLGTLTVTIPANAPSSAAYAIHFDHASASPNGIASFPKQTLTGLILLSDRSSSSYSDGIPDSWRLRYFGTVNNILSQASADADGDGASNQHEYLAGTDPTDPSSFLRVSTDQAVAQQGQDCVIHWPSVAGKRYIIERSTSLFGPNWIPVSTNTGSGTDMEIHDTSGGTVRFYRVHVAP